MHDGARVTIVLAAWLLSGCGGSVPEPAGATTGGTPADAGRGPAPPAAAPRPAAADPAGERLAEVLGPRQTMLPAVRKGDLEVDPGGVDFGMIPASSRHDLHVVVRNLGTRPAVITAVQTTRQCTAPEDLRGTTIGPGQAVPMATVFSARPVPGEQEATVMLRFRQGADAEDQILPFRVEAEVTMAIRAEPAFVEAREGTTGTIELTSVDGRPFRVISTQGQPPDFAAGGGSATAHTVRWHVAYPTDTADCGDQKLWWIIETDHPDCPILPLRIRHDCTGARTDLEYKQRGWLFRDYIVNLGAIRAGEPAEADVPVWRLGQRPTIAARSVESLSPDASAELLGVVEPPDGDSVLTVRFTPRYGYHGMLYAMVKVRTQTGDKEVAFVARVE